MERKKTIGIILLIGGVIILILSLFADPIGIGGAPGFGFKQITGTIAGAVIAAAGLFVSQKK